MINESSSFAPAKPEAKEISWQNLNGETVTATVYVRHSSYATSAAISTAFRQGCTDIVAAHLVSSIVTSKGEPLLTMADIVGSEKRGPMCQALVDAMMAAIAEVNRWGDEADPKPVTQKTSSGSNSSSPASADEPLQKPNGE
ncbi:phage tail assembly chaperone family protein, TAC [Shewanella sp. KCT]|uniref:phage tail assembly chaperone family protein, TAC n=1 Tax=Shewanella sp. KCT TaxID=2569535 RepID=UPI0016430983|nr:phage tail assembly chaperone family protein, TAC [Shewanella sp. KCT]